jgi:hypothetical protein
MTSTQTFILKEIIKFKMVIQLSGDTDSIIANIIFLIWGKLLKRNFKEKKINLSHSSNNNSNYIYPTNLSLNKNIC